MNDLTPSQQREFDKIAAAHPEWEAMIYERDAETGAILVGAGPHRWGIGKRGGVTRMPAETSPSPGPQDTADLAGTAGLKPPEEEQGEPEAADRAQPAPSDLPPPDTEGLGVRGFSEETGDPLEGSAVEVPETIESEDPDDFKPPPAELAVRGAEDIFRAMDRADEELILDELQGRAIETWIYSFASKGSGKLMTDLTVFGVNETVRIMNERGGTQVGIVLERDPLVSEVQEEGESFYRVLVAAHDARRPNSGRWGVAVEPKHMRTRDGKTIWDKFALTKALNKAQRNALKMFIPEDWRQWIIAQALQKGKVRKLLPAGQEAVEDTLPAPLTDERAETLRAEIHAAYDELKAVNRNAMLPGLFHVFLERARGSHADLEAFRDRLRAQVEHEKAAAEKEAQPDAA